MSLMRRIDAETVPQDAQAAADRAEAGLRASLERFDALDAKGSFVLAAREDGGLCGYASVVRIPKLDARVAVLWIDELYVLEAHRRRGLGRRLIRSAIEETERIGGGATRLLVEPENEAAVALYRDLGFEPRPARFFEYAPGRVPPDGSGP